MKRTFYLLYGMMAYLAFLGTILYAIGFVGNILVSKTIDGVPKVSLWKAMLINGSLLSLFASQRSVMARPAFKKWWIKIIPEPLERSTYVMLASLCLMFMMWQWQPMGGIVWKVENEALQSLIMVLYLSGWMIVFVSTFLINHFDLFGLRQVWYYYSAKKYEALPFRLPVFYRIVRHPLYFGFLIAFWSAATMTVAHLLFALLSTVYILIAIQFEEHDLIKHFGEKYMNYRKWVPMILPLGRRKGEL
jgi:protein-S-isoprenylcysteine O-methyltransferase Ste14